MSDHLDIGMLDIISEMLAPPWRPVVANDTSACGVGVSTVYAWDIELYETSLIDADGVHPVERYEDKSVAAAGHSRWLAFAENAEGVEIDRCGDGYGMVPPNQHIIRCGKAAADTGVLA